VNFGEAAVPRLEYTAPDHEVTERIRERRGGRLLALDGILLHSPEFADGWNGLLRAVREQSSLPADLREAVILRVAALNGADYEWAAHEPVARAAGLTDADLAAIRGGGAPDGLADGGAPGGLPDGLLGAALQYADAMTRDIAVPDDAFEAIRGYLSDREVLELTGTIATYNMVSRLLVALRVYPGDEIPPTITP
jgi:AhpD family alkylhydroperoxidase